MAALGLAPGPATPPTTPVEARVGRTIMVGSLGGPGTRRRSPRPVLLGLRDMKYVDLADQIRLGNSNEPPLVDRPSPREPINVASAFRR